MSNIGTANKNDTSVIVNKVLTFLVYGLNSASLENVKNVAVNTFSIEEIQAAVELLWKSASLGSPPLRRGEKKNVTYVSDLLKQLEELQNEDKLLCFAVDLIGLSQLPKFGLEEINEIHSSAR